MNSIGELWYSKFSHAQIPWGLLDDAQKEYCEVMAKKAGFLPEDLEDE